MRHVKAYVDTIRPYEPGKPIEEVERELGVRHAVKLASNENPLGPSRKALRAMQRELARVHLYPDGSSFVLKKRLAGAIRLLEDQILISNGSNEMIELLARGFLKEGDEVISSSHSFLVYPLITQACGARFQQVPMQEYRYDLKGIAARVNSRTRLIFIANPNNPTGTYVTAQAVEAFVRAVPQDVIICFDEAYVDFVAARNFPKTLDYVRRNVENVVVLRTFSKSYGLAGLRIGYGVGSKQLMRYLNKIRQPFNVNRVAQAGAAAALDDPAFLKRSQRLVWDGRRYLYKHFEALRLHYLPSETNFVLVNVGQDAAQLAERLLRKGVIVRAMNAYELDAFIRVTIGTRAELGKFMNVLKGEMRKGETHK